ncbi:glycoside hydrolase family 55 protein [Dyadobacter chenhuakuii]|uniref:Glycoside hydrolase family 55 protein n=1 Tax=Dyadobacter chenhuakuii TaxID=2909339 RepID=A0ABY4XLJ7_9BACT|nr:glycoside hydrolase family 55 protein [Dyadobacter chenhuakuii]MCF2494184.1 glycoside hydrolase family 55 protein [Dyadobacter chenhuakuii]USJ31311.1 glycoside hydrolase family 55 protein [Dyadobacter chenhuakuii]
MKLSLSLLLISISFLAAAQKKDSISRENRSNKFTEKIRNEADGKVRTNHVADALDNMEENMGHRIPFMTMNELRSSSPKIASVVYIDEGLRSGNFRYDPASTAPDDSSMVIVSGNKRFVRQYDGFVNIRWYGAVGDGKTDDTEPIIKAAKANKEGILIPNGTFLINSPIPFSCPINGNSNQGAIIKASKEFKGQFMIDNYAGGERKFLKNVKLDANDVAGLQIIGSSGDAQGSSITVYENVYFYNTHKDSFTVGGASKKAVPGMLTGATFINCVWRATGKMLNLGQNQDDIQFIGCRFHMDKSPVDVAFIVGNGSNHRFQGCYFYITKVIKRNDVGRIFQVGNNITNFENCFIEGTSNLTHLWHCASPGATLSLRDIHINLTAPDFVALIRTELQQTSRDFRQITVQNIGKSTHFPDNAKILDLYVAYAEPGKQISLNFSGVDIFKDVYQITPGSVKNDNKILKLDGSLRTESYDNYAGLRTESASKKSDTPQIDDISNQVASIASTNNSIPNGIKYKLKGPGVWLVTVTSKSGGKGDALMAANFIVYYYKSSNGIFSTERLGSIKKSASLEDKIYDLSVSDPNAEGLITISSSLGGNSPTKPTFIVNAKQLSSLL